MRCVALHLLLLGFLPLGAFGYQVNPTPKWEFLNTFDKPTLVNSVNFHPKKKQFVATFTHNNTLIICNVDEEKGITVSQKLQNPKAKLKIPQNAIFSKEGKHLFVANWSREHFNVFEADGEGVFQDKPVSIFLFPKELKNFKPHGMALSPCGNYLSVAFGVSKLFPSGIALFYLQTNETKNVKIILKSLAQGDEINRGIPKGIAFTPDGNGLFVTLSDSNSAAIFSIDWQEETIISQPIQVISGEQTLLGRPEDCAFTRDGNTIAITNSTEDTITFYSYDPIENRVLDFTPQYVLQNPSAELSFPHGLDFSPDGKYLAITQFGDAEIDREGLLMGWGNERIEGVRLYEIN